MKNVMVVNMGLKSIRCIIFNQNGLKLGSAAKAINTAINDKCVEQDPDEWWEKGILVVRKALSDAGCPQINYITVTTSASCLVCVDKYGNPLQKAFMIVVVEISKKINSDEAEGEFIGMAKISKEALKQIKAASKILMQKKDFTAYFEGAIEYLIEKGKCKPVTVPTNGEFWGEVDFIEDYERVCREISDKLVEIAERL